MSIKLKLKTFAANEIAEHTGGRVETFGDGAVGEVTSIGHNSAEAESGMLFCAIIGERFDGHDFIKAALDGGVDTVLCQRVPDDVRNRSFTAIIVEDTVTALGALAAYYRTFSTASVVAVTGSVGKTTTKEFIYSVLSTSFKTHKTRGNYNNEIGLPLTLFELEPDDQVSVLEMGMSNLGEIERMSLIARPDIAVVTNIGTSHLATLGTRENICKAKLEITAGMSDDGCLLLNGDEPLLFAEKDRFADRAEYFGIYNRFGDFRAVNIRTRTDGVTYDMIFDNKAVTNIEVPTLGKHNVYNSLVAYAVGVKLGMTDDKIRMGLSAFSGAEKRQNIYRMGNVTVIDDCYNASPESMRAAIDVLVSIAGKSEGAPCALLGDMLELGEYSRLMHDQLGRFAAQEKVQKLFCYGQMADVVAEAAIKNGIRADNVFVSVDTSDPDSMAEMICSVLEPEDVLLVKASRAVKAERVLEALKRRYTRKIKNK